MTTESGIDEVWLGVDGEPIGPYTLSQLASIIASGADAKHHIDNVGFVFWEGLENWVPMSFFVTPLMGMGMKGISTDVRLDNCYFQSGAPNLSHFLSLGFSKRKVRRNYGKGTEAKLLAALEDWIPQRMAIITGRPMPGGEEFSTSNTTNSTQVIDYEAVINSPNPERYFSNAEWKSLWAELETENFLEENIYFLCHEAGENWPARSKTGLVTPLSQGKKKSWKEMVLRDFHGIPINGLLSIKKFGRVKLRALIKAIAYRLSNKSNTVKDKPLEEQIDWIQSNAGLTDREKDILSARFDGQTLEEIAADHTVTRERIRQIQKVALNKLRSPICLEISGQYLDENQNSIWAKLSEGKPYIPKDKALGSSIAQLAFSEKLALFIYAGEKTQGEAFSSIVEGFLDRRFKKVSDHWYNLYYSQAETSAAVALVESKAQNERSPIVLESFREGLSGFSPDLISFAIQVSNKVIFYHGFIAQKPFGTRPRRAIDAHIVLSDLEQEQTVVSIYELWKLYADTCLLDPCSERDLEIVMDMYSHLFFPVGMDGWISIGKSRDIAQEINFTHLQTTKEIEELEQTDNYNVSAKIQTIVNIIDQLGISHGDEIYKALSKKVQNIPKGSLHAWLFKEECFYRFAPSYYGLRKWIGDEKKMGPGRQKIVSGSGNTRTAASHLRSYVNARYAGEPVDLYPLWGYKLEYMWAQHITEQSSNSDLLESFTYIADPSSWEATAVELKDWKERKSKANFKISRGLPDISTEKRATFQEILSALIYIQENGSFSSVRANILMGRGINWYHSVPCLATLSLLGAIAPAENRLKKHFALNDCSQLIVELKNAYHHNPDIEWGNGFEEVIMPHIKKKIGLPLEGWMSQLNESALTQHFTSKPKKAKPSQTGERDVGESVSTDGFFQL